MGQESMRWAEGFIAVDWGTTNRRAYRIDADARCVQQFEDGKGVLSVPAGGFPAAVAEIRECLGDKPLLMAGMIGSNRGWKEVPYVPCPAGIDDLVGAQRFRVTMRLRTPVLASLTTASDTHSQ